MVSFRSFSCTWFILVQLGVSLAGGHADHQGATTKFKSQPVKKYGCLFENEDFYVPTDSVFDPVYGEEVEPMDFATNDEFSALLKIIDQEFTQINQELVYNNIPTYYDHYEAYKNRTEENEIEFFKNYIPKFYPNELIAVEMLERMVKNNSNLSSHVHLVTCNYIAEKRLLEKLHIFEIRPTTYKKLSFMLPKVVPTQKFNASKNIPIEVPPKFFFVHTHVAGLLRIRIGGERLGYVLIDPGYAFIRPVVIMEDEKFPHRPSCRDYVEKVKGDDVTFYLHRRDYLFSMSFDRGFKKDYNENQLYYIGRPYCSFMMTTVKVNIPQPIRRIARHDKTGLAIASVIYQGTAKASISVQIQTPNITGEQKIPTDKKSDMKTQKQELRKLYTAVLKTLNYDGVEDLIEKLRTTVWDLEFRAYIKKLYSSVTDALKLKSVKSAPFFKYLSDGQDEEQDEIQNNVLNHNKENKVK